MGVAIFDAATGLPKSINREARRIVDSLREPDQTAEDLLEVLTFRRGDRREISLGEFPMADLLGIGETVRAEEIALKAPNGTRVTALVNATPIHSDDGTVESMVVTLQDMAAVEEMERLRAEFLAMVSHELRAPLTSIKGSASTVLDSSQDLDPTVVRQFFRIIGDQADHMHGLVSDLLDLARIETGTLAVNPEPAEAAVLVDRARSAFRNAGGENPLEIDIEPDLPWCWRTGCAWYRCWATSCPTRRATHPQSSVIRVWAVREGVDVAFSVADEGRGIPAESLPYLFRKFSRIQSAEQGGDTGLGLAICKGIVEAHGGRIWADSDGPWHGARFSFTLPTMEVAETLPPVSTRLSQWEGRDFGARVRILTVDDDPHSLRYIWDTLAGVGYEPIVTGDPEEALRLVEEEKPELVLLDMMLPGYDGIELMQDILEAADVPVIFLSVYGQEDLIVRAFDMGAVDYVVKPFSPTELAARIRSALRRRTAAEPSEPYVLGDLTIDYSEHRVTISGRPIHLTPTEYRMLAELSSNAGQL